MPESKRKICEKLFQQLKNERQVFESLWEDIGDFIVPWRPQWDNRGTTTTIGSLEKATAANQPPDMSSIIDSTATFAMRTLGSGMMSGLTSPARPWLQLALDEYAEDLFPELADWLHLATRTLLDIYGGSNLYKILPTVYEDLSTFGTSPMGMFEDFDRVVRFEHYPPGSYYIGLGRGGRVEVFAREFSVTVRQLVNDYAKDAFGEVTRESMAKLSNRAREAWNNNQTEQRVNVVQIVKENDDYRPDAFDSKFKRFSSLHYEASTSEEDGFIRESGFDFFPIFTARWQISGSDVYGTNSPGMIALGDIKQLQTGEYRSLQAIEKMVNPPMIASIGMRNSNISMLPGEVNFEPDFSGRSGMRPAHEVGLSVTELEAKQEQVRHRIKTAFFENLFLLLATRQGEQPLTATEVNELREEKLFALGPVLERIDEDLIDPMVEHTLEIAINQGRIPPPPEEGGSVDYKIEKKSVVAQAQSAFGLSKVERFSMFIQQGAAIDPSILDKVNSDAILEEYASGLAVPPSFLRSQEEVDAIRQQRQRQAAVAQAAQTAKEASSAAKDLSKSDTSGDNALTQLINPT